MPGMPVHADAHVPGLAVVAVNVGSAHVRLEGLGYQHFRAPELEAAVPLIGDDGGTRTHKVTELAHVILALERPTLVLDTAIERGHLVAHLLDFDTGAEYERLKDHRTVGEADLGVLEVIRVRLALFVFGAARVVQSQTGGDILVILEVPVAASELTRGGLPDQRRGDGVEVVVELRRADSEGAEVVADHRLVAQLVGDIALDPEPARV